MRARVGTCRLAGAVAALGVLGCAADPAPAPAIGAADDRVFLPAPVASDMQPPKALPSGKSGVPAVAALLAFETVRTLASIHGTSALQGSGLP